MNKTELIAAMSEVSGLTKKDAEAALTAYTEVVTDALKAGDSVQLIGFGTFEVREQPVRAAIPTLAKLLRSPPQRPPPSSPERP